MSPTDHLWKSAHGRLRFHLGKELDSLTVRHNALIRARLHTDSKDLRPVAAGDWPDECQRTWSCLSDG